MTIKYVNAKNMLFLKICGNENNLFNITALALGMLSIVSAAVFSLLFLLILGSFYFA